MKRAVVLLLPVVILLFLALFIEQQEQVTEEGYPLYFLAGEGENGGGDAIVEYLVTGLEGETIRETAENMVNQLIRGVPGLESPLPAGTQLRGLTVVGQQANVDFTAGYGTLSGIDLTVTDYCVTLSLTEIEGIRSVTITTNGRSLPYKKGQVLLRSDILLSNAEDIIESLPVSLYFVDEAGQVVPETRTLALYEGDVPAEVLLHTLLQGPEEEGLVSLIPPEFTISSAQVENRTCYISVPKSSIKALPEDNETQRLILECISQTVYGLDGVEELCLIVDGQEMNVFGDISMEPFKLKE